MHTHRPVTTRLATTSLALVTAASMAALIVAAPVAADSPVPPPDDIASPTTTPPPDFGVIVAGEQPTLEIIHVDTDTNYGDVTTQGTVLFAELIADTDSSSPGWWLRIDATVLNTGTETVVVDEIGVTTDVSPLAVEAIDPVEIEPGATKIVKKASVTGIGATPTTLTVNVSSPSAPYPAQATFPLQAHQNPTPTGGYRFPARATDLAPGTFWSIGGFHTHSASQRYAYDFGVVRWDDMHGWTWFTEQAYVDDANGIALGSRDAHYLVFGQPIYSMGDGVVVKCRRSIEDQEPPLGDVTASNTIGIMHDNGEYAAYAHLQQDSMPAELCPVETPGSGVAPGHVPVKVHAGQFLGYAGSSGDETPHLHVQVSDGGPETSSSKIRGLPMNFHDVFVHTRDGFDPTIDVADWNWVTWPEAAMVAPKQLVHPNSCGWDLDDPEIDDITIGGRGGTTDLPPVSECDLVPDAIARDPEVAIATGSDDLTVGTSTEPSDPEWKYVPVRRYS